MGKNTILIADDDASIRLVLSQALTRAGYEVLPMSNIATLWNHVSRGEGDLLITDVMMPDGSAFDILPKIQKQRPDLPIIVMSAQNTFMTAVKASEAGAYEYLPKPFDLLEVTNTAEKALQEQENRINRAAAEEQEEMPLVGRSAAMQEVYRTMARLIQTDLTVMISGESGTGKEVVARALHEFGKRKNGPFNAINMAAIPQDLIESELFGHEKGAFTGADARSPGHFELSARVRCFSMKLVTCRWLRKHACCVCCKRASLHVLVGAKPSKRTYGLLRRHTAILTSLFGRAFSARICFIV